MQFFKISIFSIFLHIVYDNRFVSARKSPRAVSFGSDTSLKSELGYQCLIFRVIDHYGQFQNGCRKSMISPEMYYQISHHNHSFGI